MLSGVSWAECVQERKRTQPSGSRRSTDRLYREDDEVFFEALEELAKRSSQPKTDIAKELGMDRHDLDKTISGKVGIHFDRMKPLTRALGVTIGTKDLRYSVLLQLDRLESRQEGPVNHYAWNKLRHALSYIVEAKHPMEVDEFQALAGNQGLQKFIVGTSTTTTYDTIERLAHALEYKDPQNMLQQCPEWDKSINISPNAELWRERFRVRYSHGLWACV